MRTFFCFLLSLLCLFSSGVIGQSENYLPVDKPNYTSFTNRHQEPDAAWKKLNTKYIAHPDANFKNSEANKSGVELFEQRTVNSKYFTDRDTASKFFILKANAPLHYLKNGQWLTIDKHLEKVASGVFEAAHQQEPVGFDVAAKTTYIKTAQGKINFNSWKLYGKKENTEQLLALPNWSNYTAGDDGMYIYNFFPGIDAEMRVMRGGIKTNFIVRQNNFAGFDALLFKDVLAGDVATTTLQFTQNGSANQQGKGVDLVSGTGVSLLHVGKAYMYTRTQTGTVNAATMDYTINKNELGLTLNAKYLADELLKGQLVIDPLVTSTASLAISKILGSKNCGSATNFCNYILDILTPAKTTITDVAFQFTYYANAPAGQNSGWFNIRAGTCASGNYTVVNPASNTGPGSVGTVGQYAYITNLVACLPAPSCTAQNVTFNLRFWNTYCIANSNVCSDEYVEAFEPWIMRIEGRTVEVKSVVASQATICNGASTNITITPKNGVPPYTYKWPGGETTNVLTVAPAATTTYSVLVTDQCATTTTGNITINVNQLPVVSTAGSNSPICDGVTLNLTTPNINNATFNWSGPNNFTSQQPNASISNATITASGVYTVTATRNTCTSAPVTTNVLVNPTGSPAVTIAAQPAAGCSGMPITFTATPTLGGTTPAYQWKLNGVNAGTNNSTFTSGTLTSADVVTCILTSNAPCVTPATATSNSVSVVVTPMVVPSVTIAGGSSAVCAGTIIDFTAAPVNGGSAPIYQWKVNGLNAGTNSAAFSSATLTNGNVVTCIMETNANCPTVPTVTSNQVAVNILPLVTPAVSINASAIFICQGSNITFTATPTNGGTTPAYQWKINGTNAGTNAPTFSSSSLSNNDQVTCVLTSNANCATTSTASSNTIKLSVNTQVMPAISIAAPAATFCAGTSITFTATPTNGGSSPAYQWKLNGVNVGMNSAAYTIVALANGDVVSSVLTSSASCVTTSTAFSNNIFLAINPLLKPAVSITATSSNICSGTPVTFTAVPVNGGTTPAYQWKLNGTNVGTNTPTYTSSTLTDGNSVSVVLTSNAPCATPATATSTSITLSVTPSITPAVSISASATSICQGTNITFTATPVNGGITPAYQWKINGTNTAVNAATFSSSMLANNDRVTCVLTSNANCATSSSTTSNSIAVTVNAPLVPSIVIAGPANALCQGAATTFTATVVNGGANPVYQWQKNGVNVGTNTATYSSNTPANNDVITCKLTINTACAFSSATSNTLKLTVKPLVTAGVSIAGVNKVCAGATVLLNATVVNAGTDPLYRWLVNGVVVSGANSNQFITSLLKNRDIVTSQVVPNETACLANTTVTSLPIAFDVYPLPQVQLQKDTSILEGTSFTMRNVITGVGLSYLWTPPPGLSNPRIASPVAKPQTSTRYSLTVTGTGNCPTTGSVYIKVLRRLTIPNAFSPNSDGINDTWQIPGLADYPGSVVDVFDRYGRLVFHSIDYAEAWDGTINNKALPVGTYYFIIQPQNGQPQQTGSISIFK